MVKKLIILLLFLFFAKSPALAKNAPFVVINQIRGSEVCCEAGSDDLWNALTSDDKSKNLPIGWALRYDAISNFSSLPPLSYELGILLEITPELATASGVFYHGSTDGRDWYMAKNSLLVGYTVNERKKIIDTLFLKFKERFGYFPKFTAAWIIDAWSLSYLKDTYNVVFHELTKEQYETDSYTLYGGIFNFPYYPSKNFPLLPGNGDDKLDLVIVRQTISDLLYNYGSAKTVYTSQPNDYLADTQQKKDISYFKQLINDVLNQNSFSQFGLVGFENSFDWKKYGDEYLKQIEYLLALSKNGAVEFYSPSKFAKYFQKQNNSNPSIYLSKDFESGKPVGALWYFGKNYRARLLLKDGKIILDDLRSFLLLTDPYKINPATVDYAYWVIPYLFDGSQEYLITSAQKNLLQRENLLGNTISDIYTSPFGIVLGEGKFEAKQSNNNVEIIFKNGHTVKLLPEEIVFDSSDLVFSELIDKSPERHFNFVVQKGNNKLDLGWQRGDFFLNLFTLEKSIGGFSLHPNQVKDILPFTPMFQPDRGDLPVDPGKSVFYWNNKTAIAGRNPLRLFILPLNNIGRPTQVKEVKFESPEKENLQIIYPADYSFRVSPWFVDITSTKALKTSFSITVDGVIIAQDIPIEFIPNCRDHFADCIKNPQELLSYISYLTKEQFASIVEKFKNSQ